MQTNILDLSPLSSPLQQEIIDFYEFLLEKPVDFDPASLLESKIMILDS